MLEDENLNDYSENDRKKMKARIVNTPPLFIYIRSNIILFFQKELRIKDGNREDELDTVRANLRKRRHELNVLKDKQK